MNMGQSISINGELNGAEDLTLEGHVKGKISLPDNVLTVGTNARIEAEVVAKTVVVLGHVVGNVTVKEKFELKAGGTMQGNLNAPRIAMADGATFGGRDRDAAAEGSVGAASRRKAGSNRGLEHEFVGQRRPSWPPRLAVGRGAPQMRRSRPYFSLAVRSR